MGTLFWETVGVIGVAVLESLRVSGEGCLVETRESDASLCHEADLS